ncbi:pyruvate carboxylase [Geopyxis carbonaria]|nr:pyruvate carboxylase [Geopyxis carbonaria]
MSQPPPAHKLLVANRGEIAVRVIRAAHELALPTLAIYADGDRLAGHAQKADEAVMIGAPGEYGPVEAYLQSTAIAELARANNVTLVHPGYGFLSENAEFAARVRELGMTFIGPPTELLLQMGNKVSARALATRLGIPTVPGTDDVAQADAFVAQHGLPVIVKACFGGGGRGMRVVETHAALADAIKAASSEAAASFGDGAVFLERYLANPKHIEVQVLSDQHGNHIHLFERDCSVQRRHQKIVEIAPAPALDAGVRERMLEAAVGLVRGIGYENAGTVEFLVDGGDFYFIEMNPRIQVEHTITEAITGHDLVAAQIQIALGASLPQLGLTQDAIMARGCAIQCRVTSEVPEEDFAPSTGRITSLNLPAGPGLRLDYSALHLGQTISPSYDPLLLKLITHAPTLELARKKALCALSELYIGGVGTNVAFLRRILASDTFAAGGCGTRFLETGGLLGVQGARAGAAQDGKGGRKQDLRVLRFLAHAAVNGSPVGNQTKPPAHRGEITVGALPPAPPSSVPSWREILLTHGPAAFAARVRAHPKVLITDCTWRDGQQSLLATRVRTRDLAAVAKATVEVYRDAYSIECWGGATFDVALRFLWECPWERLRRLRKLVPNIPFQMLLRSTNGVSYSALPDNAIHHFVQTAYSAGIDIFRIFDSLNSLPNLRIGIQAALSTGAVVEGAIMYTGDMLDPTCKYNLPYYLSLAASLVAMGIHVLAIKSMSGVLKPAAATALIAALRHAHPDTPIHVHTHDTNGTGVASMAASVAAGADIVDSAIDSLSGSTSQPAVSALVATFADTPQATALSMPALAVLDAAWVQLRGLYAGFDADLRSPDPGVYAHEIPGGQYSNLLLQARELQLDSAAHWAATTTAYAHANLLLGDIIKATPTSKAVGDLAQFMVANELTMQMVVERAPALDFPRSVVEYFEGLMGQPLGGFPEPLRSRVLRGVKPREGLRPGEGLEPVDFGALRRKVAAEVAAVQREVALKVGGGGGGGSDCVGAVTDCDLASYLSYPTVYLDFIRACAEWGDLSGLSTAVFLTKMEVGETTIVRSAWEGTPLEVQMLAIGNADAVTGEREVLFRVEGVLCAVYSRDEKACPNTPRPKADPTATGDVGAPMAGKIVRACVQPGDTVAKGQVVVAVAAMKMEVNVSAEIAGTVESVLVKSGDSVERGDLVCKIKSGAEAGLRDDKGDAAGGGKEKKRRRFRDDEGHRGVNGVA